MLPFTLAGFEIQHIASGENLLTITPRSVALSGACPSCGMITRYGIVSS